MRIKLASFALVYVFAFSSVFAQDDLFDMIEDDDDQINYADAVFKGTRVINGHSTKLRKRNEFEFLVSHRFGPVNTGIYEFFGLDDSNTRLGFEYGVSDLFNIGIGRSSNKTYDGFIKWKFLRQSSGASNMPVSMVLFTSMSINTFRFEGQDITFQDRVGYTYEVLISRKFSPNFSFQLMPGVVHSNTVPTKEDDNDIIYLGGALRQKISKSVAITLEYYYRSNPLVSVKTYDVIGIGIDIETGGHVFQVFFTNPRDTFEKGFITETKDNFWDGDIRFGFNISRTFNLGGDKDW